MVTNGFKVLGGKWQKPFLKENVFFLLNKLNLLGLWNDFM